MDPASDSSAPEPSGSGASGNRQRGTTPQAHSSKSATTGSQENISRPETSAAGGSKTPKGKKNGKAASGSGQQSISAFDYFSKERVSTAHEILDKTPTDVPIELLKIAIGKNITVATQACMIVYQGILRSIEGNMNLTFVRGIITDRTQDKIRPKVDHLDNFFVRGNKIFYIILPQELMKEVGWLERKYEMKQEYLKQQNQQRQAKQTRPNIKKKKPSQQQQPQQQVQKQSPHPKRNIQQGQRQQQGQQHQGQQHQGQQRQGQQRQGQQHQGQQRQGQQRQKQYHGQPLQQQQMQFPRVAYQQQQYPQPVQYQNVPGQFIHQQQPGQFIPQQQGPFFLQQQRPMMPQQQGPFIPPQQGYYPQYQQHPPHQ